MGLRLQKLGCVFLINKNAISYHLVHSMGNEYYKRMMKKSIEIMNSLHKHVNFEGLYEFVNNKIDAKTFEKIFYDNNKEIT